jgi:hypothetical protein
VCRNSVRNDCAVSAAFFIAHIGIGSLSRWQPPGCSLDCVGSRSRLAAAPFPVLSRHIVPVTSLSVRRRPLAVMAVAMTATREALCYYQRAS